MKLTLGISPCPNDTFIFDALLHKKIDTGDFEFDVLLEDVQTLNDWAAIGKLDITKLSFPALFKNVDTYSILNSGAALGKGVGPLLIAKKPIGHSQINQCTIAIPGQLTTANFLLSYAFPDANNKIAMLFSSIEDAVLNGDADLGVIIHENRFTYQQKGLINICDLGEVWEQKQNLPIPLGCIAVRNSLPPEVQKKVDTLIKESIAFAWQHYPNLSPFVTNHAQEMHTDVMRQHIELYVNDYTTDLGAKGKSAIIQLFKVFQILHASPGSFSDFFSAHKL